MKLEEQAGNYRARWEKREEEASKPRLAGNFQFFHPTELLALLFSMRKTGQLTIRVPYAQKTIFLKNGEVVFASSSVEDDRLIELLWQDGLLDLDQLSSVYDEVRPGVPVGKILIERGFINAHQLGEGLSRQVLHIVYSTFLFDKGEFEFVEGAFPLENRVHLDMTTREIIMEGLLWLEEKEEQDLRLVSKNNKLEQFP